VTPLTAMLRFVHDSLYMQQPCVRSYGGGTTISYDHMMLAANDLCVSYMLQAPAGQPPDVSARLRRACDMATAANN